jgi:hypothetical protein
MDYISNESYKVIKEKIKKGESLVTLRNILGNMLF